MGQVNQDYLETAKQVLQLVADLGKNGYVGYIVAGVIALGLAVLTVIKSRSMNQAAQRQSEQQGSGDMAKNPAQSDAAEQRWQQGSSEVDSHATIGKKPRA